MASIFETPLDDVESFTIRGQKFELKHPNSFMYREYVRRIKEKLQTTEEEGESEGESLSEKEAMSKLLDALDTNEEVLILQIAICMIWKYPKISLDDLIEDLTINSNKEFLGEGEKLVRKIFKLDLPEETPEDEKKPSTPT